VRLSSSFYQETEINANRQIRKRQFSRKIIEWGFRKNVPMSERRLILQKLSSGSQENMPKFKDLRLKPTKLNNWRKRYREEVRNGRCLPNEARKRFQGKSFSCVDIDETPTNSRLKKLLLLSDVKHSWKEKGR
jgi:hypothetical protein